MILWVHKDDLHQVTSEIAAYIPNDDDKSNYFEKKLHQLVLAKQIHKCRDSCRTMRGSTSCKYGFPYKPQL